VDPVRRKKMRHSKEESRFHDNGIGSSAPEASGPDQGVVFDQTIFEQIRDLLGNSGLSKMLTTFEGQLQEPFTVDPVIAANLSKLAARAHTAVSVAGMLGFTRLSEVCRELEHDCLTGNGGVAETLAAVDMVRCETLAAIKDAQVQLARGVDQLSAA
jgi:HPt (histidine-containing phosphotransfer) domain-containing protein